MLRPKQQAHFETFGCRVLRQASAPAATAEIRRAFGEVPAGERGGRPTPPCGGAPRAIPYFPLDSQPGDGVLFDPGTGPAAVGGQTGRRRFALHFSPPPTPTEPEASRRRRLTAPFVGCGWR